MKKVYHQDLAAWRAATAPPPDGTVGEEATQSTPSVTRARERATRLGFDELPDIVSCDVSRPRKRKKRSSKAKNKNKNAGKSSKRANVHRDSDYSDDASSE